MRLGENCLSSEGNKRLPSNAFAFLPTKPATCQQIITENNRTDYNNSVLALLRT